MDAVAKETGARHGSNPPHVDPDRLLQRLAEAGSRLAAAAHAGQSVQFATGHPAGLLTLLISVAQLYERSGGELACLGDGVAWERASLRAGSLIGSVKRTARLSLERLREEFHGIGLGW